MNIAQVKMGVVMDFYKGTVSEFIECFQRILDQFGDLPVVRTIWDGSQEEPHVTIRVEKPYIVKSEHGVRWNNDWVSEKGGEVPRRVVID